MKNEKALIEKDDSSLPFRLMDALDDQMIIQELEGRLPEILTYHFAEKGQEIWGLSKAGVDEAKGELAKQGECIRELEVEFKDNDNEAFFTVKAGRYVVSKDGREIPLDTAFGFKRQPKKFSSGQLNSFWFEQGGIKAARNASMRLIPATIKQAVIEYAKQKGKVKEVKKEEEIQTIVINSPIDMITKKDGVKNNKPYSLYTIYIQDQKITTFSKSLAETAKEFANTKESANIEYKTTEYGMELVNLTPVTKD